MKKLIACASVMMLTAPAAQADMLGVYAGIQGWFPSVEGAYGTQGTFSASDDFNLDRADNLAGYIKVEHPVPVIPNVMLRYTNYETSNDANTESVDVQSTDLVLYYEVLDFDVGSLDLGFSVKQLDGDLLSGAAGAQELSVYLPTLYAAVSTEIPFTGVSAFGSIDYIGYDGSDISDWKVGVGYTFIDNLAIDLTAQIGYRATSIEVDDVDDIYGSLDYEGVFVGLEAHF